MLIGSQVPSKSSVPKWHSNHSDEVVELCAAYGLVLDQWQQNVLRAASGEDAFGNWTATRVGLSVPRQCGKTALFEARELAGLLLYGEELIIHSAHLLPTALEGFDRIKSYFENYDDLGKKVRRIRMGNGDQSIEMMSGQRLLFKARALGSGRGFSPDCLMLDEAQILGARQWSSMFPSMSARPNPQAWLAGTPPTEFDDAEAFTNIRESALAGRDKRSAWLEWSMDRDADLDDKAVWAQAIPALGGRIQVSTVEDERNSMSDDQFSIERLGYWHGAATESVINADSWADLGVSDVPTEWPLVSIGLDMNHERTRVTIAVAARSPGGVHLELAEDDPFMGGTDELVAWLVKRAGRKVPVVLDAFSPIRSIEPELRKQKVMVRVLSAGELSQACGGFYDAVMKDGTVSHYSQEQLDQSLDGAVKQKFGDGGAWKWNRKNMEIDLTPTMAVTCAHFGAVKFAKDKPSGTTRRKGALVL